MPTPADRGPGRPWRPGTPPPAPIDPDLPSADIRIGYARCSTLGQELDSQLDALSKHGVPRDKIFSEKISTRVRVRPTFEEALRMAREVKAHAPHCRELVRRGGITLPATRISPLHMNLARSHVTLGNRDLALEHLEKAWKLAPQLAKVHPTSQEVLRVLTSRHKRSNPRLTRLAKLTDVRF
ncbi:recombinase family protein [Streptomyces sp. NPDC002490]|uniref:recombinase family protein n=1 Tax=Streptomyces sp. NPDC002490 TaxID=3154416 RepID=UPI0033169F7E